MKQLIMLTKRNMLNYFKDKQSVFFSFLSVIILLVIYLLFLKNMFGELPGLTAQQESRFFVGYIIGGVLVVATLSLSLGVIGNLVSDFETKKINGILVTPVSRYKLTLSYFISTVLITTLFTIAMFVIVVFYLGITSGYWYSFDKILSTCALLVLYVIISSSLMVMVVSFIKSINAFGAVSSIVGTLVGFVSGIYIPLTMLDAFTKTIASLIPFSHMTLFLRKVLIGDEIFGMLPDEAIQGAGLAPIKIFGADLHVSIIFSVAFVLSLVLILIAYIRINRKQTK